MSVGQKIKMLRKTKGLTQSDLAKKLDIVSTAVSAWERDANKPMLDKIALMADIFEVPVSYFFDAEAGPLNVIPVQPNFVKIPILGTIACGDPILADENHDGYRYEPADTLPKGNLFYLKAKGNSMEPTVPNGSYVLIREQPEVEYGEIAAVLVNGDTEMTLKRVKKQGDTILLMPDNPEHEPYIITEENPAHIIGKAVRYTQDL
ncbi:XRE family transcriptional regulator [Lysinibacillus louembei]|uniref:XRE family transcriptional regulator n=2 Tax=Lysinibacillus louembei TaxID=1470088 RepID=A0ABZ0RX10_9BACI|nr:XRE family transcriptional regulator [Lysinibacillus louembei]WPK11801.1 XRE family transcriptional regulator [Lysinibacillus louembei]